MPGRCAFNAALRASTSYSERKRRGSGRSGRVRARAWRRRRPRRGRRFRAHAVWIPHRCDRAELRWSTASSSTTGPSTLICCAGTMLVRRGPDKRPVDACARREQFPERWQQPRHCEPEAKRPRGRDTEAFARGLLRSARNDGNGWMSRPGRAGPCRPWRNKCAWKPAWRASRRRPESRSSTNSVVERPSASMPLGPGHGDRRPVRRREAGAGIEDVVVLVVRRKERLVVAGRRGEAAERDRSCRRARRSRAAR